MKTNTFAFLLFVLFAISSLSNVYADADADSDSDDLFDFDDEFDTSSALDEDIEQLSEFEVNGKKSNQCRLRLDNYPRPNERCIKQHCSVLCKRQGFTEAKCRKSRSDIIKVCYCYKDCPKPETPTKPDDTTSPPAASPVYDPPAASPAPVVSPVYPPFMTPVGSPAYPPSSHAPGPGGPSLEQPCEDSDDDVSPPSKKLPSSVGEFSDEDFDLIFS